MKVLHVLNELRPSGAEVMLHDASDFFTSKQIETHVLSTGEMVGDYASALGERGYVIHHMPFRKNPGYLVGFFRFLRSNRFDVAHIHAERAFIWHVVMVRLAGTSTVIRAYHNVFLFTGWLRIKRIWQRKIAKLIFGLDDYAVGESVQQVEKKNLKNRTRVLSNWTDVGHFVPPTEMQKSQAREGFGVERSAFAIITVGNCSHVKNHVAIFDVLESITDRMRDRSFVLLHVGAGADLQDEIKYTINKKIHGNVRFLGNLGNVKGALHAADAFVMSSYYEGLPMAVMEAMSAGLPVVLYNVYGLRDFRFDGRGGFWVEPTPAALVEPIVKLAGDEAMRLRMGKEARQVILEHFDMQTSLERLYRLYRGEALS